MAESIVVYTVIHQPRRVKLPAQPIPKGAAPEDIERCLFDDRMNERYFHKVSRTCYYPALDMFEGMIEDGFKLSLGFSLSFVFQALRWDHRLLDRFSQLVNHPNVELICVEPYHSFLFYLDIQSFIDRMNWAADTLTEIFQLAKRPTVTDTTEMFMSNDIYFALEKAGFKAALMDGRPFVMQWRQPTHIYHYGDNLKLLTRHYELSDDVGYRFSNRNWDGWPLQADQYADWLREAQGDIVSIGWDFETFGEHHGSGTGIFEFMRNLPREMKQRNLRCLTASEAVEEYGNRSSHLPLPEFPSTWAGDGGVEFFLSNAAQQAVFQLMHHAYNKAQLTGDSRLLDLALWLTQSDNLHLIQWFGRYGSEAEVSAYFTPREWWDLGPDGIIWEIQQVFKNYIRALDHYTRARKPKPVIETSGFDRTSVAAGRLA